jgi:hypothetical protein
MLLVLQTPCIRATENVATIIENQTAPFSGYLVKERTFRSMLLDLKEKNILRSELQICLENKSEPELATKPEWFAMGAVLGFVAGASLVYAVSK